MSLDSQVPQPTRQPAVQAPPAPQQGTSGLAVAGLIFAFLFAPIGFILSLIAFFKTGAGRRKGRGLAVAGLIFSAISLAGLTTVVVMNLNSKVVDPGCVDGKAAIVAGASNVDENTLQKTIDALNAAAAKATHDDVRAAMKALADDYTQLAEAMTAAGEDPAGEPPADILDKIDADAKNIDKLCTVGV
jgi:hypothetical protein